MLLLKTVSKFLTLLMLAIFSSVSAYAQESEEIIEYPHGTKLSFVAKVDILPAIIVGESKNGVRRVVPITGGTFEGPEISGLVLPGGEDWQLVRPDGVTELYARYLLQTHDGYIIQVINRVLAHNKNGESYRRSVIDLEAPLDSPYDYLNQAIFLGTLDSPQVPEGQQRHVVVTAYELL